MIEGERAKGSTYMEWAKTRSRARFNLATSGMINLPLGELEVRLEDLELSGPSWYGYEPLQQALAAKCGVPVECVVAANGTSMANYLAMAALIERGDEVLIEHPAYDPLRAVASYLGAEVKRFPRRSEDGFRIDPDEVSRCVTRRTRLIVMTNLHNPTGALTDTGTLSRIGEIAAGAGARVLVDEVYLEAMFGQSPRSAFHLGEQFVVTSSLTKAYGLSGLRCGWVLAEPSLAKKMWRLNDLFGVIPAHPAERLSVIALARLDRAAARPAELLAKNRPLLQSFLEFRSDLESSPCEYGTVAFPRLLRGSVDHLCRLLREKYDTSIVPGRFFEMPDYFRVGIACETEVLGEGLVRLGAALDEMRAKQL